jgi:dipeptidyl-peptidase-4
MKKLFIALMFPILASAQQKTLSVADAVLKQRSTLAPARINGLSWIPNSHNMVYYAKKDNKDCVVFQDANTLNRDTVLTLETYNALVGKAIGASNTTERIPVERITWLSETSFRLTHKQNIYVIDYKSNSTNVVAYLPEGAEHLELEPSTGKVAFVYQHNVVVVDQASSSKPSNVSADGVIPGAVVSKESYVTTDGKYGLQYGVAVHRNEFGINKGLFWSPKGKRLAYYQMNEAPVTDYGIYELGKTPAGIKNVKYPTAGAASHVVKVFVKDFEKNRTIELQTGVPSEQYLTNVTWHPGEEKIYIAVLNREQNEMKLNEYDAVSGSFIRTIFKENHPKYVEPEHGVIFRKNNPKQFLWFSERDGYKQLYLYHANGRLERQLTTGKFDVTAFLGFSNDGNTAYYMAASEDGLNRYCYGVDLNTGKNKKITMHEGVHYVSLSSDGSYLIDVFSNTTTPRKTILMGTNGDEKALLLSSPNPLTDYARCEMRLGKIKAADGVTDLNYRMFLPNNFSDTAKYPVIVYVYGGPHAQMVTNSWLGGSDMWLYSMAQQGYVVFTLDNRGSAYRGLNFENVTHRKLGVEERADQLKGVEFLKGLKYVDASRLGVFGWSFGGFMSTGLMTKSDVFKVGVAGGPVIDWNLYEIMYTERYMDTPKENPEGYEESNLLNNVKNLKGKLLLIHGTDDDVVLWQHSLQYIKKCVDEGVQLDYFVYPGHLHNVLGKDRVHLMQKITDYFNLHL